MRILLYNTTRLQHNDAICPLNRREAVSNHEHAEVAGGTLKQAFFLTAVILVVEAVAGVFSHSLALLADAGHILTDVVALGLAWFAVEQAKRPADSRRTYGYHRVGILTAMVNGASLIEIVVAVAYEAVRRLAHPEPVHGGLLIVSALVSIAVHTFITFRLKGEGDEHQNLNIQAALLHVLGELAASVGVIIAGEVVAIAGNWLWALDFFHIVGGALWTGIDLFVGLLITIPVMFVLGVAIEWAFIPRLKREGTMLSILVTFAVALIIEGVLSIIFSTNNVQLHAWYVTASIQFAGFYLAYIDVFAFILSFILLGGLYILLYRTKFGHSLRASMQNRTAAALIGIDVEQISMITFGIGVALAAAGGVAYGATTVFNAASAYNLVSQLLVIIVLGGMGSLRGAFFGSLIMLVISDVTAAVCGPQWASTVFFVLLVVLLVFRPQGLFGLAGGRRRRPRGPARRQRHATPGGDCRRRATAERANAACHWPGRARSAT